MNPDRLDFDDMLDDLQRATCSMAAADWASAHEAHYLAQEELRRAASCKALGLEIMPLCRAREKRWAGLPRVHEQNEKSLAARLPDGRVACYNAYTRSHVDRRHTWGPLTEHLDDLLRGRVRVRRPRGLPPLPAHIRSALGAMGVDADAVETFGYVCRGISMAISPGRLKAGIAPVDEARRESRRKEIGSRRWTSTPGELVEAMRPLIVEAMRPLEARGYSWSRPRLTLSRNPTIALETPMRVVVGRAMPLQLVNGMSGRLASDVVGHAGLDGYSVANPRVRSDGFAFDLEPIDRETTHG
jgi:hypothetical protein